MNSTCPICFEELTEKSKATPDVCDHVFCFRCLEKWSKHGSYCPVDRKRFRKIVNLASETVIQVKPCRPKLSRIQYDVTIYCEICKKANNARTLLLCDCCDLGYHCLCLTPPLEEVPAGVWYCPVCVAVENRIKKLKDPKVSQQENQNQNNQKGILVTSESSQDNNLPRTQVYCTRSRGSINLQEQYRNKEIKEDTLRKDDAPNNIYKKTIDVYNKNHTNADKSETSICMNQELHNKEDISSKSLRKKEPSIKIFDVKNVSLDSYGSIERNKEDSNCKLEKSDSLSMRLRSRVPILKPNEIENDFSKSQDTDKYKEDVACLNIGGISRRLRRSNRLLKTKYIPDNSSKSQNNSSKRCISLKKQVKKGTFPVSLRRNLHIKTVDIKNSSHTTKGCKHDNRDHNKKNNSRLRKKENQIIRNNVTDTMDPECDFSEIQTKVTRSLSRDIHNSQRNSKKYFLPTNLKKRENRNNFYAGAIDSEELSAFHANIAENVSSSQENGNNDIFPYIRKIENENSKDCKGKTVDSGEDFQASLTTNSTPLNILYIQDNDKNDIVPESTRDSRNWKDFNGGTIYIGEKFPGDQYHVASEYICQENDKKDIVPPSLEIEESKNLKNFYEGTIRETDGDNRATQSNIKRSCIAYVFSDQELCKKNDLLPNAGKGDIRNSTDPHREIINIGLNSPAIETNKKTELSISRQELYKNDSAPSLVKIYNRGDFLEIKKVAEDSPSFPSNIAQSELVIRCSQEDYKNLSKKEVCWNHQDVSVNFKDIQNNFPAIQSNISKNQDTTYNVQKEYGRKAVSCSFIELKNTLTDELESNNKALADCSKSTNKTGVLINQELSRGEHSYFDAKKGFSSFDVEDLSFQDFKKNAKKSRRITVDNWCCMEEQDKAFCINQISGNCTQLEMIPENLHQVSSPRSTMCVSPSNIPTFNNSDEDQTTSSPRFSVFEPLKDTFASSQKYLNMSIAVNKTSLGSHEPLSLFSKSFSNPKKSEAIPSSDKFLFKNQKSWELLKKDGKNKFQNVDLDHNPFSNRHSREVHCAIEAKMNLAHELKKIEKEKWSQSLKKYKHSQLSHSAYPKKLGKK